MVDARENAAAPLPLPEPLARIVGERRWERDAVGEAGGEIYRLHAPGVRDLYLKRGSGDVASDVVDEMVRARWLAAHLDVPAVRGFVPDETGAWLLTEALPGRTAYQCLQDDPADRAAIVEALADHLRRLHAIPLDRCPYDSSLPVRMARAWGRVERGEVDVDDFDDDHAGWTAMAVWTEINGLLPIVADPVVTHGDYSLDNVLMVDGRVTGCIDLGRVGVADRYQDLAILANCLDEFDPTLRRRFFAAYGIDPPDERKLRLHRCLDELF